MTVSPLLLEDGAVQAGRAKPRQSQKKRQRAGTAETSVSRDGKIIIKNDGGDGNGQRQTRERPGAGVA